MTLEGRLMEVPVREHCAGQAKAAIGALTREHEQVLALNSEVRAARLAGDVAGQAELACQLAAVLGPHAIVEERGLFPALAQHFPESIALLVAEHRTIEAPLAEAVRAAQSGRMAPVDPKWPDRLTRALGLLRDHIFKEQDVVFPVALATLGTPTWDAIDAVRADVVPARVPALPTPATVAIPRQAAEPVIGSRSLVLVQFSTPRAFTLYRESSPGRLVIMRSIALRLFGPEAGQLADLVFGETREERRACGRVREAGAWCGTTPGDVPRTGRGRRPRVQPRPVIHGKRWPC